jgi:hypothetical protein
VKSSEENNLIEDRRLMNPVRTNGGFMKTCTTHLSGRPDWWTRSLGAILAVVLILPSIAVSQSPSPVNLGTAGDFVILTKTGISATGVTKITGDIGVSPIKATGITGFGLILDASGTFSVSSLVTGKVYASDYTDPTPAKMTTAIGDMETAYTNAAGRSLPDFTELYAGDVTGQTLTPGLYKWGTGVLVSAGGVTISGTASDVWIFQIAQNLVLADGAMVNLIGGAKAFNIFWQVAGQATLGKAAAMEGVILCKTAIVMTTGATLEGRALAQTAATLDANTVVDPGNLPLPAQLASFTLKVVNATSVQLEWRTISETNNFGFYVQRKLATESSFSVLPNSFVSGHGTTLVPRQYSFTDNFVVGVELQYRLKQVDLDGNIHFTDPISVKAPTSVSEQMPAMFLLQQNYPNPFNPSTLIAFATTKEGPVSLRVYDILGREVTTLVNENRKPGQYTERFDGSRVASGVYVYVLNSSEGRRSSRMTLSK